MTLFCGGKQLTACRKVIQRMHVQAHRNTHLLHVREEAPQHSTLIRLIEHDEGTLKLCLWCVLKVLDVSANDLQAMTGC